MRSRLMTVLVLVVVLAVAGVGVLYAAGNGPMDSAGPARIDEFVHIGAGL